MRKLLAEFLVHDSSLLDEDEEQDRVDRAIFDVVALRCLQKLDKSGNRHSWFNYFRVHRPADMWVHRHRRIIQSCLAPNLSEYHLRRSGVHTDSKNKFKDLRMWITLDGETRHLDVWNPIDELRSES